MGEASANPEPLDSHDARDPNNPIVVKRHWEHNGQSGDIYWHWCQACKEVHGIHVGTKNRSGAVWTFNGSLTRPTFHPSIRCLGGAGETTCHYFIVDGMIKYEGDMPQSKAEFRSKHLPLEPVPNWLAKEGKQAETDS